MAKRTTTRTSTVVKKVNISEVKIGDIFSESSHYQLLGTNNGQMGFKHLESGAEVLLTPSYVEQLLSPADQYTKEVKVTKEDKRDGTPGIRTIWDSIHSEQVFTVCFKKQDDVKSAKAFNAEVDNKVNELIVKIEAAKTSKKGVAEAAKLALLELAQNPISKVIEGEDRILRGYKKEFTSRDGKFDCMDMVISQIRPVNINTIKWLVFDGVKYTVEV